MVDGVRGSLPEAEETRVHRRERFGALNLLKLDMEQSKALNWGSVDVIKPFFVYVKS